MVTWSNGKMNALTSKIARSAVIVRKVPDSTFPAMSHFSIESHARMPAKTSNSAPSWPPDQYTPACKLPAESLLTSDRTLWIVKSCLLVVLNPAQPRTHVSPPNARQPNARQSNARQSNDPRAVPRMDRKGNQMEAHDRRSSVFDRPFMYRKHAVDDLRPFHP